MASIFDLDDKLPPRTPSEPEPVKRSKNRETLSGYEISQGKRKLADMVDAAFNTLQDAMKLADYATAIKAAQIILDRAGFGPKSTVDVNSTHIDLTNLTREELAARAMELSNRLRGQKPDIEVTSVTIQ